jgi:hypothetical protein
LLDGVQSLLDGEGVCPSIDSRCNAVPNPLVLVVVTSIREKTLTANSTTFVNLVLAEYTNEDALILSNDESNPVAGWNELFHLESVGSDLDGGVLHVDHSKHDVLDESSICQK